MGCWISRGLSEGGSAVSAGAVNGNKNQPSLLVQSSNEDAEPAAAPSLTCSSAGSREIRPEQLIQWKLHPCDESAVTFKALNAIKDAACAEIGVRKAKISIGLYGVDGSERLWLKTSSGAFSPAMSLKDTVMGEIFTAFQDSGGKLPTLLVIPDLRQVLRLKDHPAVVERPHFAFTASALMTTRMGDGRCHALGIFSLWDSKPNPQFTPEQEAKLVVAAAAIRAALQRQLFIALGMNPDAVTAGAQPLELPAVWIDLADPDWRVLGINCAWELLTGVDLQVLESFSGLLKVLVSSDGTDVHTVRYNVAAAVATLPPDGSLALIMSPCGPTSAGLLQYIMALRRAVGPPPLPAADAVGVNPWVIECHACLQSSRQNGHDPVGLATSISFDGSDNSFTDWESESTAVPKLRRVPALASLTNPTIPPRLASLELGQILGSGSYASVYAGRLGDRPIAIKIIRHAYGPVSSKDDWLDHYEAICNVDNAHENIVATLDWARLEDVGGWSVWIVEELADKGSLSSAIRHGLLKEGHDHQCPPDMHAILPTACEIARGMRYLHSMGEIHGDLSSNNVLLVSADNPRGFVAKVSDFGLSRLEGTSTMTQTIGTVSHMAPELLIDGNTSKSADVFSFGVILWELWTGKRAWAGMGQYQVIFAMACRGDRIQMPPDAPKDYAKLATECMSQNHKNRPSFDQIVPRMDAMLAALGQPPPPPPSRPPPVPNGHPIMSEY